MSLATNAQLAQVFQATVSVLHSLHTLHSVIYIRMDIGCDLANALAVARAVVFQSLPACNRLDMHDSLHVTNLP